MSGTVLYTECIVWMSICCMSIYTCTCVAFSEWKLPTIYQQCNNKGIPSTRSDFLRSRVSHQKAPHQLLPKQSSQNQNQLIWKLYRETSPLFRFIVGNPAWRWDDSRGFCFYLQNCSVVVPVVSDATDPSKCGATCKAFAASLGEDFSEVIGRLFHYIFYSLYIG